MSNQFAEWLFLLAFWVPPLAVLGGAFLLLLPNRPARGTVRLTHTAPLAP